MNSVGQTGGAGQPAANGAQASCGQAATNATDRGLAQTILNHKESRKWIDNNSDAGTGGMCGSVTQISNGIAQLVGTITSQGTRLTAEHFLSTALMLNGSICRGFLAVVKNSWQKRDNADLPTEGTGNIHRLESACASVRSILQCVHDLEDATRNGLSNHEELFGQNVSSASLWLSIPELSALLLVAVCEVLSHGVESGALCSGALSEFEPFCKQACDIISQCSKDGGCRWRECYKDMEGMVTDQCKSKADKLPPKARSHLTVAPDKSRQATHGTFAVSLFSAPIVSSKLALLTELKSFEGCTAASQKSTQLSREIGKEESQAGVVGWPETGSFGRLSSLFNSIRELIHRLDEEGVEIEGRNKQSMASTGLSTSNTGLCLSVMLGELLTLRSVLARLSQAPRTSADSKAYSKHTAEGTDSKQTLSQDESKNGSLQTHRTEHAINEGLDKAKVQTQHNRIKADRCLVSAASELPATGHTGVTGTKATLTVASATEEVNNATTTGLHKASQITGTAPLHLTTEPFRELRDIVQEVSAQQNHPQYSTVCNSLSKLTMQFEAVQAALMHRSSKAGSTKSTYSGTLSGLMEPTALASLSVQTLSQLCKHFALIQEAFAHCSAELRAETGFQSEQTRARSDVKNSVFSNTIESASQSVANTTEVSQAELRRARERTDNERMMRHEVSLSAVETALSIAGSEVSKVLTLLTANSGNTLRQVERQKYKSNLGTIECEKSSNAGLSNTTQHPEQQLCDNDCSGGLGAATNTSVFGTLGVSGTMLKLFETVHSLGSAVSETLLQALIFATHPIDQTLSAIEAWKDRPWVRESHPIAGESRSVSTEQQSRITADVATMVRNILCVFCISSGSSNRQELVVVPAPVALRQILNSFGRSDDPRDDADVATVLDEMRELTLEREETLYRELVTILDNMIGRRQLSAEHVASMKGTLEWIGRLKTRHAAQDEAAQAFDPALRGYVLHMIHMVQNRRWSGTAARRKLTPHEVNFLLSKLLEGPPAPVLESKTVDSEMEEVVLEDEKKE